MKRNTLIFVLILFCFGGIGVLAQNDRDGDGIPDTRDSCPDTPGIPELNGCPILIIVTDSDGDGVNDNLDQCPTVPGLVDNNGCPASSEPPPSVPENPPVSEPQPPAPQPPVFSPPALPVDGCFVTPNGDYSVNVRETTDLSADRLGYLYAGVVYEALGYVIVSDELWFVMTDYQQSAGLAGYASRSVLNASACPELAASANNNLRQLGLAINSHSATPPTTHEAFERLLSLSCHDYVIFWSVDADGNEIPNTYGGYCTTDDPILVQSPVPASSRSTPKLQEAIALGTYYPAICHGVTVLAWARVDGTSSDDVIVDGNIITAENFDSANTCEPPATEDQAVIWVYFGIGSGEETEPTQANWDAALSAYCTSDYMIWWDADGRIGGMCVEDMDEAVNSTRIPAGLSIATHTNPLDLTVFPPSTSAAFPTEQLSFGYTEVEWTYDTTTLGFDLRGTKFDEPRGNDDGTTTVEYCIYVELYEEGVLNQVCYEIEIPANCTLTTSEAGVYTVDCEDVGGVSVNPNFDGLPALDFSVHDSTAGHSSSVNMLMGDGSVRFFRDSINP